MLGQADRILFGGLGITILDYKSGAISSEGNANRAHLAQLGSYRLALQKLYPGKAIRAALLDTTSKTVIEADLSALDLVLEEIQAGTGKVLD
jgi:ATP-dependent helicase/nuclease subunit A